jgi:hypothetical protein
MTISSARASLLTYLLALTGCAGIPLLCFAAYLTMGLGRTEQAAVERGVVDTVNALVTGVDREFHEHDCDPGGIGDGAVARRARSRRPFEHGAAGPRVSEGARLA